MFLPFALVVASFIISFSDIKPLVRHGKRHQAMVLHRGTIQFIEVRRMKVVGVTPSGFATEEIGYRTDWRFPVFIPRFSAPQWPPFFVVTSDSPSMLSDVPSVDRYTFRTLALWPLLLLTALGPTWWLLIYHRRAVERQRRVAGLCPRCGYDLRASSDRCPECGLSNRAD